MKTTETVFVIPTYRLRDVAETIELYDEHFWSNGHSVKMIVFDDSSLANYEKYFSRLEQTKTINELNYVGPREKEQFLSFLNKKLRDRKLEALELFAENLARSFYGFEPDFFQQNVSRIVDDVVSQIHAALEIWPTLIEICYFHKDKREFPQRRIDNKKRAR